MNYTMPTNNGEIDFDFMENFVAELEAYLLATGLKDYALTEEERNALDNYKTLKWSTYNLEELFGKSTRGKRLKGDDRIAGTLPFVTAGEACEGISAFIGNKVEIFESNTATIDMFGSAKYRNYRYGADDHVAVVHTEKIEYKAAILCNDCRRSANAESIVFAFCGVVGQILSASSDRKRVGCGYCLHAHARGFDTDGRRNGKRRKRTRSGGKNQSEIPENENYHSYEYAGVFLYKACKTNRR